MIKTLRTALAVIFIIVIAVCATLITQKVLGRAGADLTEQNLYTLSDGTRDILKELTQPVTIELYYSRRAAMKGPEEIRHFNTYFRYVRDLLEEYVAISDGRIRLEIIDPRRYSTAEEYAIQQGLRHVPLSEEDYFFFGLIARTDLGKQKVIEFFDPARQQFIEYDLTKLISSVTRRDKRILGVLSSADVTGGGLSPYMRQMMQAQGRSVPEPWYLVSDLRAEEYDIRTLPPSSETIPDDLDYLMIVHPQELSERTLFAIDQYVMQGGRLLVFQDPHFYYDPAQPDPRDPMGAMNQDKSSDLNALLRGWGVEMDPERIAADRRLAAEVGPRREPLKIFLRLDEECMNEEEVVTADVHDLLMLMAGSLDVIEDAGTEVVPLITTTDAGNAWHPEGPHQLMYPDPETINKEIPDGTEPLTLACRITGPFQTNFPDGIEVEDEADEDAEAAGPEPGEEADAVNDEGEATSRRLTPVTSSDPGAMVLVFADVDFIANDLAYEMGFFVRRRADNIALLYNALDFLSGSEDLIRIRTRGSIRRPFEVIEEIEQKAEEATAEEIEKLNAEIEQYQEELNRLGASGEEMDEQIIAGEMIARRREISEKIEEANRRLRELKAQKLAKVEALTTRIQTHNMVWAPAVVLLIAVSLAAVRWIRARRYILRRAQS